MRDITNLEQKIFLHCLEMGYKYAAFNGNHVRLFDCEEKPWLKGSLHRIENGETII